MILDGVDKHITPRLFYKSYFRGLLHKGKTNALPHHDTAGAEDFSFMKATIFRVIRVSNLLRAVAAVSLILLYISIFGGKGLCSGYLLEAPAAVRLPSCSTGDTAVGAFTVKNSSDSPVLLYIYSSCICLEASPDTAQLKGGESSVISFLFSTDKMSGLHSKDIIFKTMPGGPVLLSVQVNILIKPPADPKPANTGDSRIITIHVFDLPKGVLAGKISEMLSGGICGGAYRMACASYNIQSPYAASLADKFFTATGAAMPEAPFIIIGERYFPAGEDLKRSICEGAAGWSGDALNKFK